MMYAWPPLYLIHLSTFLQYLSIGNDSRHLAIAYNNLKTIELYQVSFEDMKEILVVIRLITSSPNLKELQVSVSPYLLHGREKFPPFL